MKNIMLRYSVSRDHEVRITDLGINDSKGRSIGVEISTWSATLYAPGTEKHHDVQDWYRTGSLDEAGDVVCAWLQGTRNGTPFGGSYTFSDFRTVEQRDAWIAKRIAAARARYTKLAA
jgi:hypothetical protein